MKDASALGSVPARREATLFGRSSVKPEATAESPAKPAEPASSAPQKLVSEAAEPQPLPPAAAPAPMPEPPTPELPPDHPNVLWGAPPSGTGFEHSPTPQKPPMKPTLMHFPSSYAELDDAPKRPLSVQKSLVQSATPSIALTVSGFNCA